MFHLLISIVPPTQSMIWKLWFGTCLYQFQPYSVSIFINSIELIRHHRMNFVKSFTTNNFIVFFFNHTLWLIFFDHHMNWVPFVDYFTCNESPITSWPPVFAALVVLPVVAYCDFIVYVQCSVIAFYFYLLTSKINDFLYRNLFQHFSTTEKMYWIHISPIGRK